MEKGYIICVDDQSAILDSLMTQLENAVGDLCEVETAESGEEALELLEELEQNGDRVDMIISDEVMPGLKGCRLLELVHQRHPEIIKVMLTGQAGLNSVAYAINNAGLAKYFTKPWEYEDLRLSVRNLLERSRFFIKNQILTRKLEKNYQELEETYNKLSLAYEQLQETQRQLVHAEKLSFIGQLSSGIAHEVKNQLNMFGFAELLQDAYPDDAKIQKYTGYILNAGHNIYNLIDEMRRFAKKEERQYEMELTCVTTVLDNLLSFLRFDKLIASRRIISYFPVQPSIWLNKEKFGQVMINLIRNAAAATSEETGEIIIRVSQNETHVSIKVQDNGSGISAEHLPKIWEPFFTTKGDEGTGLGLDICKRIIEEHQGTISCESRKHVGTTFTIALPMTIQSEENTSYENTSTDHDAPVAGQ